ncbi:MAG: alanine racemase [Acidobacteriota bacterium]
MQGIETSIPRRPTQAIISLDNLAHNFRLIKKIVGNEVAVMPAMKADAYGHGAIECARVLEAEGAAWFAVALPEEGVELREAEITKPILSLGGFWEGQEELLIQYKLTPVMFRLDLLKKLNAAARRAGVICDYHLKVDTGMGRLGVSITELENFLDAAMPLKNVRLDGLLTHIASADVMEADGYSNRQFKLFEQAQTLARKRGQYPRWIHAANSATLVAYPQAHCNLIRPGNLLYGNWRDTLRTDLAPQDWRAVMTLRSQIIFLKTVAAGTSLGYGGTFVSERESRIATIAIGYEDGLPRVLSNRGRVLVRGQFAPIVGRISMDLTLVDVTDITEATLDDEVVIMGRQGDAEITAEEIAQLAGTISYEITCGISARVPRIYKRQL